MIAAVFLTVAMVVEDRTALRAAASDTAAEQAMLWKGDWLEVRGERGQYFQVYDHRHERPGYVRSWRVRSYALDEPHAADLRSIALFLRDGPGSESLGIGYAAMYLKAAPAGAAGSDMYDAIGTMAERLAARASSASAGPDDPTPHHLEVAASYGVTFTSVEQGGRSCLCYDGEAFRRVLAMASLPEEHARAALSLTRAACVPEDTTPAALLAWNEWRRDVLDRTDPSGLAPWLAGRLRLRKAQVLADLSYAHGRGGRDADAAKDADEALRQLVLTDRAALAREDLAAYDATAVQVEAVRAAMARTAGMAPAPGDSRLVIDRRDAGQTCLRMVDAKGATLCERCTYGLVRGGSVASAPRGTTHAVAVQLLPAWTELWVAHRTENGFAIDSLLPAVTDPRTGYAELAGFSPDGRRLLLAREALVDGQLARRLDIVSTSTLAVEMHAASLDGFHSFRRWASPVWMGSSLALR